MNRLNKEIILKQLIESMDISEVINVIRQLPKQDLDLVKKFIQ